MRKSTNFYLSNSNRKTKIYRTNKNYLINNNQMRFKSVGSTFFPFILFL